MLAPYSASHNANAAGMASSAYGPPVSHTPDGTARALEAQTKAYRNRYAEPIAEATTTPTRMLLGFRN